MPNETLLDVQAGHVPKARDASKDVFYCKPNTGFSELLHIRDFRTAWWDEAKKSWSLFTGARGGKLRQYKTLRAMDAAMAKLNMVRR